MNRKLIFGLLIASLAGLGVSGAQQSGHTFQVTLTLNNTANTVFIPGSGSQSSSTLPTTETLYSNPPHFYLASYSSSALAALVFSQTTPASLSVRRDTGNHYLTLNQSLSNSQLFLAFTKGDERAIDSRMEAIERGTFLEAASPSFSFGLGTKTATLLLSYPDIDIRGNLTLTQGTHELTLESNTTGGLKVVMVNRTG